MIFFVLAFLACGSHALYVDPGSPYDDGPLINTIQTVVIEKDEGGAPVRSTVYYPDYTDEEVGLNLFIGGFYGLWSGEMYSETLKKAASHGFVVLALDTDDSLAGYIQNLLDTLDWAEVNLANFISSRVDWNSVQFSCHSAGCHGVLGVLRRRPSYAKSTVMTDPVTWDIQNPVDFSIPAVFYGTGLAGSCVVDGWTFDTFYEQWSCTRILHVVQGYGHCDYMDQSPWSLCTSTGFCDGGPESGIPAQRQYVQGLIAGMFMWQIQGQGRVASYLTDRSLIPVSLEEFLTDVC